MKQDQMTSARRSNGRLFRWEPHGAAGQLLAPQKTEAQSSGEYTTEWYGESGAIRALIRIVADGSIIVRQQGVFTRRARKGSRPSPPAPRPSMGESKRSDPHSRKASCAPPRRASQWSPGAAARHSHNSNDKHTGQVYKRQDERRCLHVTQNVKIRA